MDEETAPEAEESTWTTRTRLLFAWEDRSKVYWLAPEEAASVGRGPDNAITIADRSVSRRHLVIRGGSPIEIVDAGSANGVRVGGRRLAPGEIARLGAGEIVEFGRVTLVAQEAPTERAVPTATRGEETLGAIAQSDLSVLLLGETGTGKTRMAERIHQASRRAGAPFVTVGCAAIPDALLEAELFGYERGAFTGAAVSKAGLFETGHGGTVFFDEIAEMSVVTQAKLLTVVESRAVLRLGAVRPKPCDVRIIAATNRPIDAMLAEGRFREDLYFRLNGFSVRIPPLRERPDEIVALAEEFLREARPTPPHLSEGAMRALTRHPWPGNVRELRTTMLRAAVLARETIEETHLELPAVPLAQRGALRHELNEVERRRIIEALDRTSGNQTEAAKLLGLSRRGLLHRLDEHRIPRPRKR